MFRRVEAQMVLVGINKKDLARSLGIGYNTLLAKMSGTSPFTFDEVVKIKDVLQSDDNLEDLFAKANPTVKVDENMVTHREAV